MPAVVAVSLFLHVDVGIINQMFQNGMISACSFSVLAACSNEQVKSTRMHWFLWSVFLGDNGLSVWRELKISTFPITVGWYAKNTYSFTSDVSLEPDKRYP